MNIQFIRHATFILSIENKKILVDPMLSDVGALPPVPFTSNRINNPLIPLPIKKEDLIRGIDAVLITHYHFDHIDNEAIKLLPKDILIFCQPGDHKKLKNKGFLNVTVIDTIFEWGSISIERFPGNHAVETLFNKVLGKSSSYFIKTNDESLFITSDSVIDKLFIHNLEKLKPALIVANTGSAEFVFGKPITLSFESLKIIKNLLPDTKIIAVHMDAINHCRLTKEALVKLLKENLIMDIKVPFEGDLLSF